MNKNLFNIENKIFSNINNTSLEILKEINQLKTNTKDELIIKSLEVIINKINYIITENNKNLESIKIQISSLNKTIDDLKINSTNNPINNKEIIFEDGKYIGQVLNGIPEGKGIYYYNHEPRKCDRYEGDFRNDKFEGKGIMYYNNGDREMGDYSNDDSVGKHITLKKMEELKLIL